MRRIYPAAKVIALSLLISFPCVMAIADSEPLVSQPPPQSYGALELDPRLMGRVKFWVDIYAKYNSWEMVIHDLEFPEIVYSVVDTKKKSKSAVNLEKSRISRLLLDLNQKYQSISAGKMKREKLKSPELEILSKIEALGKPINIKDLADMKRIRGQAGLRDGLMDALFWSGRYLPRMEKVFENFSLPLEIAYLPFVESGFNKRAVSKVGASGIWQFMPYTGKLYLRVDDVVDERNDPMRAAEAAARLMKQNYQLLGEWPLAITAYNHGAMGIANAAKEVGSKSLVDIIEKYESKSFGFASQNFYASFMAALHVAKNSELFLGSVLRARKLEFDEFVMPDYMDLAVFLEKMDLDPKEFHNLNPALTSLVYSGKKYIPVGYTVRVPVEARGDFLAKYEKIPALLKYAKQRTTDEGVGASGHRKE